MEMISKTLAIASALAVLAATTAAMASDRDHEDRGTRLQSGQNASVMFLHRGGWDGNGPDMFGTIEEERGTRVMYRTGRGGWDANGPDSAGALTTSREVNLDSPVLEAVELPGGKLLGKVRD
jgi:hypothetical protein